MRDQSAGIGHRDDVTGNDDGSARRGNTVRHQSLPSPKGKALRFHTDETRKDPGIHEDSFSEFL
jgi:hypothetical protein